MSFATTVRLVVDPGQQAEALRSLRSFAATLTLRSGFLGYSLLEDLEEPGAYVLVERWRSLDALKRHLESESFLDLMSVMDMARREPMFEIEKVDPVDGIDLMALVTRMESLLGPRDTTAPGRKEPQGESA